MAPPARAEAIPPAIAPNIITSLKWLETNNLFNNLIQRNQSAAFSSGKVRPNHETNINIIARRTGKDVNSHTVLDGIITTIMATIQRINIIGSREGSRNRRRLKANQTGKKFRVVISSFGGKTSYDADNRPLLVMRSNLWASGYDVDGTDQTSLGQFSGRVQQTYKHSVPRFFVPEHGTMFTLALVRFPPTATKEIQYLNAKGALTYTDIAGDPVLYGNLP